MYRVLVVFLILLAWSSPAKAEFPKTWHNEGLGAFLDGELLSTAIHADGSLRLGHELSLLGKPAFGNFLDAVLSSDESRAMFATGNGGGVFGLAQGGTVQTWFERRQSLVSALELDRSGQLYAALSPNGHIYRRNKTGKFEVFADIDSRYIWDMLANPDGSLLIATGDPGVIYRLGADGRSEAYWRSEDANLKVLYRDDKVGLLVGSGSQALVYRITTGGKAQTILDSPLNEITAITGDRQGHIFVAAMANQANYTGPKSIVYMIDRLGRVDTLFRLSTESIYSLALTGKGTLMIGSGPQGRIYEITQATSPDKREISLTARAQAQQVVKLLPYRNGNVLAVTSNPAGVELYQAHYLSQGFYHSKILGTELLANWGAVSFQGLIPGGTEILVQARSGNSPKPDKTWSDWSVSESQPTSSPLKVPPSRYLQLRFQLKSRVSEVTPQLHSFTVSYQRRNVAPVIRETYFLQKGLYFTPHSQVVVEPPKMMELNPATLQKLAQPQTPDFYYNQIQNDNREPIMRYLQLQREGMQTLAWEAGDDNADNLNYDVYVKRFGTQEWRPVARNIQHPHCAIDTLTLLDGHYHFRIFATDAPSNLSGQSYRVFRETNLFTIDNTPPNIEDVKVTPSLQSTQVRFQAQDALSQLVYAQYAWDSQPFQLVAAADGLTDNTFEAFVFQGSKLPKGRHTLAVRVLDRAGNLAVWRQDIQIP